MTIYWDRCDFCGQHRPVKKCSTIPDISIDIHCCISCPLWLDKCKSPAWKISLPQPQTIWRKTLSGEEKERILKELTSLLKEEK